jgi:hypothetical protein
MTRLRGAAARQQGPASAPATQRQAAREAAVEASQAAPSPASEARAQAEAGQAEVMNQQRAGRVEQSTFLELVERQLNAVPMPRNPEEMDRFRRSGGAGGLREQLQSSVGEQAAQAQGNIRSAAAAQPASGPNRQPSTLPAQGRAPAAASVRAEEILPQPRAEQEVSLEASRQRVEGQMRENNLTEERLREANDPRFNAVQEARASVHEQAERAPREYRAAEQSELQRQETAVARDEQSASREMSQDRERAGAQIATEQREAMTREEAERRQVSERIERMFTESQGRVQNKLTWLDGEVDRRFTAGEARARQMFESFVEEAMFDWKLQRYGRWLFVPGVGAAYALGRWVADKLVDINRFPEIQAIYDNGKRLYLRKMRELIVEISGVVESSLRWCTDEIARARNGIQEYVNSLPQALRRAGEETSRGVSERFDQLRNSVNERREALANRLVERYRQAQQQLDQRIQQMQAANRGLINRFVAAIREVVEIINNFRRQLMSLIGEARSVVDRIVERPVNFVHNLVRALRMGFDQFSRNIWTHLRGALLNWLFGTLAQAGITLPTSFDLRSIIGLILQILGISYDRIRGKVARIIGERNMAMLEHAWRYVSALVREGPIGLWNEIRNDLSNLWEMALQSVREWVVSQLVRAAVTRLVSMFNPAGAIIQAVLAIYNTVTFFVEKIQQIMELVRTIVRSLDKIVRGDLAEAANWVENAMARTLPVIIGFLAQLLGLTGLADRLRGFIQNIQARVDRAIDAALERIVNGLRRLFSGGAQGAAALPRQGVVSGNVTQTFTMKGKSHTLTASIGANGSVRIVMASDQPDELKGALRVAIEALRQRPNKPPDYQNLQDELAELDARIQPEDSMYTTWDSLGGRLPEGGRSTYPFNEWVRIRLGAISRRLFEIAAQHNIKELHDFFMGVPDKRYLPRGYDVRQQLYIRGSSWGSVRAEIIQNQRPPLVRAVIRAKQENDQQMFDALIELKRIPVGMRLQTFQPQWILDGTLQYDVDHTFSLAEHWQREGGNNSEDGPRWGETTRRTNLRMILARPNRSKGSSVGDDPDDRAKYTRWVGPDFFSKYANNNQAKAKKIDGQPFLQSENGPPIV